MTFDRRSTTARGVAARLCILTGTLGAAGLLASCTQPAQQSDQQIQQQAEKTTEQVKAGAKVAAADAKVAAADATRKLNDIAQGVRDGLHDKSGTASADESGKPTAGRLDLNAASKEDLETLPGVTAAKAQEIIDSRPYGSSHDLVAKGVLSESRYERISRRVTAR